jgi:zinc D-Ala-D-Ala carboxypeptidase
MARTKQPRQRINYWILIAVIILALLLIFSRSRRAPRMAAPPADNTSMIIRDTSQIKNTKLTMNNAPVFEITAAQLTGKTDPQTDERLVLIESKYASRQGMYMHSQAYEAFKQMHAAAIEDGISLTIISAMRSFQHQKRIWEGKWNGNTMLEGSLLATEISDPVKRATEILRYSSMPGTSRHHWGTDIDINSLQNSYFANGRGKREYQWLQANASRFGFFQPYTALGEGRDGGYQEEKWHWSYFPVAGRYLQAYQSLVNYQHIQGFQGWETASEIDVITNYVFKVANPE